MPLSVGTAAFWVDKRLLEVLADISLLIVLLTNTNNDGAIFLLLLADDLVTSMGTIHRLGIPFHLAAVGLQNGVFAQKAIILLHEHQSLQNTGCLDTLHYYTSSGSIRYGRIDLAKTARKQSPEKGYRLPSNPWQICCAVTLQISYICSKYILL